MSRAARTQLLQAMGTLCKANRMVGISLTGKQEDIIALLAECQECAIAIGTKIEQLYGEGTQSVSGLETYCEMVYQITQQLGDKVLCRKLYADCEKCLIKIREAMETEMPDRLEAVFLPYKASMWDSLESVWKAADEDPNCDAYVIPIPYFDKNPDGSFREEHYEGDLYPKYVPITRYDEYDFEGRRPDMIFIHNPYDDANFVTSVYPFFYSKNLKKFTDKLVYIPYFILGETAPENRDAVETMRHFCMTPGVIHANKVIVQSEDMRQIYINVMTKAMGEHTRAYWEEKILGLGSPKVDKVLTAKKEELEIPKEWLSVIQKPDGSWKNIVFYNTGVSALLQYGEQMFIKMRDVFRVFKEKKDEVALLWRPHPLIKSTLETMRPQFLEEYERIVEQYREEGWGIYDNSADLDRAVVMSDAYYGDGSSVAVLFLKCRKDAMVQNPCLTYDKPIKDDLWSFDFVIDGDCIWFVPYWYNLLCCYNLRTSKMKYMLDIPEKNHIEGLYNSVVKMGSRIILIPNNATKICIYDMAVQEWKTFSIVGSEWKVNLFWTYGVWKNTLSLFPQSYDHIVKLNLQTDMLEYVGAWKSAGLQFQMESCIVGSKVYLLVKHSNRIVVYDMEDESSIEKAIGNSGEEYFTICNIEGKLFYLSNRNGDVIIWNEETGEVEKKVNSVKGFAVDASMTNWGAFNSSVVKQEFVYFFPGAAYKAVKININTGELSEMGIGNIFEDGIKDRFWKFSWYSKIRHRDGWLYGFDTAKREFFIINAEQQKCNYSIGIDDVETKKVDDWYNEYEENVNLGYVEIGTYYLHLFKLLQKVDERKNVGIQIEKVVGKAIYEACK